MKHCFMHLSLFVMLPSHIWSKFSINSTVRGKTFSGSKRLLYVSGTKAELIFEGKTPSEGQKGPSCGRSIKLVPALHNFSLHSRSGSRLPGFVAVFF